MAGAPWWGILVVRSMKGKTAKAQATFLSETSVDVLKHPHKRVFHVLSDNTASVPGERGGCVTLVQRKLRGEYTTPRPVRAGGQGAGHGQEAVPGRGARGEDRGREATRVRGRRRGRSAHMSVVNTVNTLERRVSVRVGRAGHQTAENGQFVWLVDGDICFCFSSVFFPLRYRSQGRLFTRYT